MAYLREKEGLLPKEKPFDWREILAN
jgi:hypothetical protein